MLCPRCQSDNRPGAHTCWNCLSPLDGALAQRFAQKPPDASTAATSGGKRKSGGLAWIIIGVLSFLLLVGSLGFFAWLNGSSKSALEPGASDMLAQQQAAANTPPPSTDTGSSGSSGSTAGGSGAAAGSGSGSGPAAKPAAKDEE